MNLDYAQLLWVIVGAVITWLYKELTKTPVTPGPAPNPEPTPTPTPVINPNQFLIDLIQELIKRLHQSKPVEHVSVEDDKQSNN